MERLKSRLGWALAGALGLSLVLALARGIQAGPLDPPGPVGSTMRTIDEQVPSWGKTLTSSGGCTSQRFTCVMGNAAVLDHETGLVWQRVPSTGSTSFTNADQLCREALIGGRHGWRLPSIDELLSMDDETTVDSLPAGHPFTNTPDTYLWSQTADTTDPQLVQTMTFLNGGNGFSIQSLSRFAAAAPNAARAWCVRGSSNDQIPPSAEQPSWSRQLDATGGCHSARFTCVLPTIADSTGEAVLDHETGLVWEKSPSSTTFTLENADIRCQDLPTGGRVGWRMPKADELLTLLDPAQSNKLGSPPALPAGHPFLGVSGVGTYWVTDRGMPPFNSNVNQESVSLDLAIIQTGNATDANRIWCVRGANGSPTPW